VIVDQKLKDSLEELNFAGVGKLDHGSVARRMNMAIAEALRDISQYPFRDGGKVEARKVVMSVIITPVLRETKEVVFIENRNQEVKGFALDSVTARVKITCNRPDVESADVKILCDIQGGAIRSAHFNPENNHRPEQLELPDMD